MDSLDLLRQLNYSPKSKSHHNQNHIHNANPFPSYQEKENEEEQEQQQNEIIEGEFGFCKSSNQQIKPSSLSCLPDQAQTQAELSMFACNELRTKDDNDFSNVEISSNQHEQQNGESFNSSKLNAEEAQIKTNQEKDILQVRSFVSDEDAACEDNSEEDLENVDTTNICEDDEEAEFIAHCTDVSSVLNSNDPTRHYYINKLYQPLNSNRITDSPSFIEQDDEYLLYQELRFLETSASSKMTKILEDDDEDGDDDADDLMNKSIKVSQQVREDPLDRLQLTNIIEAFESSETSTDLQQQENSPEEAFAHLNNPSSSDRLDDTLPLTSSCQHHHRDNTTGDNKQPDSSSTFGDDISAQADNNVSVETHSHQHIQDQNQQLVLDAADNQQVLSTSPSLSSSSVEAFIDNVANNNYLTSHLLISPADYQQHHEDKTTTYLLAIDPEQQHDSNNESHLYQETQQQQQQDEEEYTHNRLLLATDNSREISYFQQVSSTFMSPPASSNGSCKNESFLTSSNNSLSPLMIDQFCNKTGTFNNNNNNNNSSNISNSAASSQSSRKSSEKSHENDGRPKKRTLQQMTDQETSTTIVKLPLTSSNVTSYSTAAASKKKADGRANQVKRRRKSQSERTDMVATSSEPSNLPATVICKGNLTSSNMISQPKLALNSPAAPSSINLEDLDDDLVSYAGEDNNDDNDSTGLPQLSSRQRQRQQHPHMNKYRRRTANARERIRMREINQAFEKLKKVVPLEMIHTVSGDESDASSQRAGGGNKSAGTDTSQSVKLTKITTLRLAVSYIARLSEVLSQYEDANGGSGVTRLVSSRSEVLSANGEDTSAISGGDGEANAEKTKIRSSSGGNKFNTKKKRSRRVNKNRPPITSNKMIKSSFNNHSDNSLKPLQKLAAPFEHETSNQQLKVNSGNLNENPHQTNNNNPTFLPIQQQQQHFSTYAYGAQQPLTISQTSAISSSINGNSSNRTFVTPVAVAILGIQTTTANQNQAVGANIVEPQQALQLLGIQSPALHQRQQHTNQQFNLISGNRQQPQQVTFTLDDINGLSVLRLANSGQLNQQQQQRFIPQQALTTTSSIQIQPNPQQNPQNQTIHLANSSTAYGNYNPTYHQPLQISQIQAATNMTTANLRPLTQQQATTVRFCNDNTSSTQNSLSTSSRNNNINLENMRTVIDQSSGNQSVAISGAAAVDTSTSSNSNRSSAPIVVTSTGNNSSDRGNFSISQNGFITQHLSSGGCNTINSAVNQHQPNYSNNTLLALTTSTGTQLFQAPAFSGPVQQGTQAARANIIYLNPANLQTAPTHSSINNSNNHLQVTSNFRQPSSNDGQQNVTKSEPARRQENSTAFEQMKFVTQFSSSTSPHIRSSECQQSGNGQNISEASIRQLVASLTTSIRPGSDSKSKISAGDVSDPTRNTQQQQQQQQQQLNQQQQPTKRTYRFHNYDGSMITNHLYGSSNHDKQSPNQLTCKRTVHYQQANSNSVKQAQPQQQQQSSDHQSGGNLLSSSSQRSRQNSLSSTCSTTSSRSSSSLISSLSTSVRFVKSPNSNPTSGNLESASSPSLSTNQTCLVHDEIIDSEVSTGAEVGSASNGAYLLGK